MAEPPKFGPAAGAGAVLEGSRTNRALIGRYRLASSDLIFFKTNSDFFDKYLTKQHEATTSKSVS